MMYGDGWGPGWGWMMLMPVLWIVLLAVIVWAVVRLVQPGSQPGSHPHGPIDRGLPHPEAPEQILARRFASGEIDGETYTAALDRLAGRRPGSP